MIELAIIAACLIAYALWRLGREILAAAYIEGLHKGHEVTAEIYEKHLTIELHNAYRLGRQHGHQETIQRAILQRN